MILENKIWSREKESVMVSGMEEHSGLESLLWFTHLVRDILRSSVSSSERRRTASRLGVPQTVLRHIVQQLLPAPDGLPFLQLITERQWMASLPSLWYLWQISYVLGAWIWTAYNNKLSPPQHDNNNTKFIRGRDQEFFEIQDRV